MGSVIRGRTLLDGRTQAFIVSGVLAVLLVSIVSMLPLPYALMSPGPVRDVLSGTGKDQLIQIKGHQTYPTEGTLDLLTVRVNGGPGAASTIWGVLDAWIDPDTDVRPVTEVYPPEQTREEADEINAADMADSQATATAAALKELDIPVQESVSVKSVSSPSHALGKLETGDKLISVDGVTTTGQHQLREQLDGMPAGQEVTVVVERDGTQVTQRFATMAVTEDGKQRTVLGFVPRQRFEFPFEVQIKIDNIGGPSAGMMFSLGIIDKLTPGALTGGKRIAGTGTVTSEGEVGAIGGIPQKLVGAKRAGAEWFLAPAGNCNDLAGRIPSGLRVVRVATLAEAKSAVETIAGGDQQAIESLPGCQAG